MTYDHRSALVRVTLEQAKSTRALLGEIIAADAEFATRTAMLDVVNASNQVVQDLEAALRHSLAEHEVTHR